MGEIAKTLSHAFPFRLLFEEERFAIKSMAAEIRSLTYKLALSQDQLADKTLELESLKNKIVERAQVQPIIMAKSAAEIRRMVEAQNEREFEESLDGR